jgi:isopenicillin N synthase-like dioxygenase
VTSGFTALPVIDIAALRGGDPDARHRVAARLGRAAREVGFMYVSGHGIAPELFEALRTAARRFFAQPLAAKMACYIGNSRNHRGYVPEGEESFYAGKPDRKEAFDLAADLPADDPDVLAGNPLLGPNQWPDLPGFREPVAAYYAAVMALGRDLMRGFAMALGLGPHGFDRFITRPPSQLRLIHYPFDAAAEDALGIGAHTDYECFTLLHATGPGLEVMNGAGRWIDAPPVPGAFIVNIGDMLELWTGGAFVATSHRVRKVKEERYAFPLFFAVDYDTRVEPLPGLAGDGRPARPGLVAGEHLFAQTVQSFAYLQRRLAAGEIALPGQVQPPASFGQQARQPPR